MKGGLGNQLFCYAAARRLALVNDAELVIDDVSGFRYDRAYRRQSMLDPLQISARAATPGERFEPFERMRRKFARLVASRRPFEERRYIEQQGVDFEPRLLDVRVRDVVHLDGLWQSEGYFADVADTVAGDLEMRPPEDSWARATAEEIREGCAVAVHVRFFDAPDAPQTHTLSSDYYRRAIQIIQERVANPRFFLFSDDPAAARERLGLENRELRVVSGEGRESSALTDLWLMRQCEHFIIANSTFSWWGAWLGSARDKVVIAPDVCLRGKTAWGFPGLVPDRWTLVGGGSLGGR